MKEGGLGRVGGGVIVQLLQTPRKQLFFESLVFYFQDWLDDEAERAQGSFNNRTTKILIRAINQVPSFFCFLFLLRPYNYKTVWFSICCEPPVVKSLLTPQNDRKNWFASLLRYVYPSGNWKCLQNTFFLFLRAL